MAKDPTPPPAADPKPAPWKLPKESADAARLYDQVKEDGELLMLVVCYGAQRLTWLLENDPSVLNSYLDGGTLTLHLLQVGQNAATERRRRLRANVPLADADKEVADTIVAPSLDERPPAPPPAVAAALPGKIEAWRKSKPARLFDPAPAAAPA